MRVSAARYSVLSAFMGEIEAARVAGMMAARKAQMASAHAATVRVSIGQNLPLVSGQAFVAEAASGSVLTPAPRERTKPRIRKVSAMNSASAGTILRKWERNRTTPAIRYVPSTVRFLGRPPSRPANPS